MIYRLLADVTLLLHLLFVLFVVLGGFFVLRWRRLAWIHIPAVIWGVLIELFGWICPLTPLENHFRRLGGEAGYAGGFVERYLLPLLYPGELTRELMIVLGLGVLGVNVVVYGVVWRRRARHRRAADSP